MANEPDISKLLKLKRYERPPAGYFDDFLSEFQSRQRAELLHRPLMEIIWDRLSSMAPTFHVPRIAYASMAALALAASTLILTRPMAVQPSLASANASPGSLSLNSPQPVTIGQGVPVVFTSTGSPSVHYVLPARPVSYASPRSF